MTLNILLHIEESSPKLEYVLFNISEYLDINFTLTTNDEAFISSTEIKIAYSDILFDGFKIPNTSYLTSFALSKVPEFEGEFKFENDTANFDLFSAMFYLLARVEEYQSYVPDSHGRFTAQYSILVNKKLHKEPVIEQWLISFRNMIEFRCGKRVNVLKSYNVLSTVDIDHIYAFKAKPLAKQFLSLSKDILTLNKERLSNRVSQKDPFDQYDWLSSTHQKLGLLPIYFILCAERSKFDRSLSPHSKAFMDKVRTISDIASIGLHPSYQSNESPQLVLKEKKKLESIIDKSIYCSRQHYLKLKLPNTYKSLIHAGITHDYSMGFAEDIGFRAGTSRPFYWYDLEKDEMTDLKITPFQVMDVTLNKYLGLKPEEAVEQCTKIIRKIKDVRGTFSIIWHNSSLADFEGWGGWSKTYLEILEFAVNN